MVAFDRGQDCLRLTPFHHVALGGLAASERWLLLKPFPPFLDIFFSHLK